ncbi:MAG: hypothetical protein OD814_000195 [Candidatus Alkanophagales archaeon MCA70_species_1]|nr:hypothetical protein [Candidatus Alkanophaga volatiphilum]
MHVQLWTDPAAVENLSYLYSSRFPGANERYFYGLNTHRRWGSDGH